MTKRATPEAPSDAVDDDLYPELYAAWVAAYPTMDLEDQLVFWTAACIEHRQTLMKAYALLKEVQGSLPDCWVGVGRAPGPDGEEQDVAVFIGGPDGAALEGAYVEDGWCFRFQVPPDLPPHVREAAEGATEFLRGLPDGDPAAAA